MDRQTEYLIARNQVPRGQITTRLLILLIFLIIAYAAIWYFWPTSNLANLPYCIGDLFPANTQPNTLNGVYISPRTGPRMDNFDLPWVHMLRFNGDDQVMYAHEIYIRRVNWREILTWFNWKKPDNRIFYGRYVMADDQIQFTTSGFYDPSFYIDWSGTISEGELLLDGVFHLYGSPSTKTLVFSFYNLEQCPFGNSK